MSIYKDLLDAVDNGKKFKVDLIEKSLWIDRKQIIKKGEIVHEQDKGKELIKEHDLALNYGCFPLSENPWEVIEVLYHDFKHSSPRENSSKRSYFKALSVDELTDADLAYGYDRDFADAMLSGYILLSSLVGWLKWNNEEHWFWQSTKDNNLIVIKNWV